MRRREGITRLAMAIACITAAAGLGGCHAAGGPKVGVAGAIAAGGLIGAATGAAIVPGMILGAGVGAGAGLFAASAH